MRAVSGATTSNATSTCDEAPSRRQRGELRDVQREQRTQDVLVALLPREPGNLAHDMNDERFVEVRLVLELHVTHARAGQGAAQQTRLDEREELRLLDLVEDAAHADAGLACVALIERHARAAVGLQVRATSDAEGVLRPAHRHRLSRRAVDQHDRLLSTDLRGHVPERREFVGHGHPSRTRTGTDAQDERVVVLHLAALADRRHHELVLRERDVHRDTELLAQVDECALPRAALAVDDATAVLLLSVLDAR